MEVPTAGHKKELLSGDDKKKIKLRDGDSTHHSFPVMVEVELNASQQELVLRETFLVQPAVPGQVVDTLLVSVPLDPAEVLHDPLRRPGQALGVGHHLVDGDVLMLRLGMQIFPAGLTTLYPSCLVSRTW